MSARFENFESSSRLNSDHTSLSNYAMPSMDEFRAARNNSGTSGTDSLPTIELAANHPNELTGHLVLKPRPGNQHPTQDS